MPTDPDVIIIGAGVAGLSAAIELGRAGLAVSVLEARNRIGGRVFTLQDPVLEAPIELGAEFIHGRPPEIWNLLEKHKVKITEIDGDNWCVRDDRPGTCDFFSEVDAILQQMDDRKPDQSFMAFLEACCRTAKPCARQREAKQRAIGYVTGFNAADPSMVSVHWLVKGMRAEEKIEGDRAFRAEHGYQDLIEIFSQQLRDANVSIQTGTVVDSVNWLPCHVKIGARGADGVVSISAPVVLITIPLGVLQARPDEHGAIRFIPEFPSRKQAALEKLVMGRVIRVTLRFRQRFWEKLPRPRKNPKTMAAMSFLLSDDDWFPTWWTTMPEKLPIITGWAPFHCAGRVSGQSESFVVGQSLQTLHRLLGVGMQELEGLLEHAYFHDWQSDPFARGAYSYAKVGADGAQQTLAAPIENTLFFAGEATDVSGHNGTVHGAIASGKRSAKQILRAHSGKRR